MASIYTNFPKISDDERCHAILEDGSRCRNQTFLKQNGRYSKWCPTHSTKCSRLNGEYKESCKNINFLKCNKKDSQDKTESKYYALNQCYRGRTNFENECLHPSKRDEGHQRFIDFVLGRKERCENILASFPPRIAQKTEKILSETDKINIALDEIILSIPDTVETLKKTPISSRTRAELMLPKEKTSGGYLTKKVEALPQSKESKTKPLSKKKKSRVLTKEVFEDLPPTKEEEEDLYFNIPFENVTETKETEEIPKPRFKYKMSKEEESKFVNSVSRVLKDLPMKERLAMKIKLIDEENKKRSFPQIETYTKLFSKMTREAINSYQKTADTLKLSESQLSEFDTYISNLEAQLADIDSRLKKYKNNFDGDKWQILINALHLISVYSKQFVDFFVKLLDLGDRND